MGVENAEKLHGRIDKAKEESLRRDEKLEGKLEIIDNKLDERFSQVDAQLSAIMTLNQNEALEQIRREAALEVRVVRLEEGRKMLIGAGVTLIGLSSAIVFVIDRVTGG